MATTFDHIFRHDRPFQPEIENRSYLAHLNTPDNEDEDDDEDGDDDEDDDDEEEDDEKEGNGSDDHRDNELDDTAQGHLEENRGLQGVAEENPLAPAIQDEAIATQFMRKEWDAEEFRDQAETIEGFCGKTSIKDLETMKDGEGQHVALLDEREPVNGLARSDMIPVSMAQLLDALQKNRFALESESKAPEPVDGPAKESDASRRLIYIPNLSPECALVLASTASWTQASVLKRMLFKYLTSDNSISVRIKAKAEGYQTFSFEMHLPFFALRKGSDLKLDTRTKGDGWPLRESWKLPPLPATSCPDGGTVRGDWLLYDGQISLVVSGIHVENWIAIGLVDNIFDKKDSVRHYSNQGTRGGRIDPLRRGKNAKQPVWDPRSYFLQCQDAQAKFLFQEWEHNVRVLGDVMKKQPTLDTSRRPVNRATSEARAQLREEILRWYSEMLVKLELLSDRLSFTVEVFKRFQEQNREYFHNPAPDSLRNIADTFSQMGLLNTRLEAMINSCKSSIKRLDYEVNHESGGYVERSYLTGESVRHLGFVMLLISIITLNAELFGTQPSLMPFPGSWISFMIAFIPLMALLSGVSFALMHIERFQGIVGSCLAWLSKFRMMAIVTAIVAAMRKAKPELVESPGASTGHAAKQVPTSSGAEPIETGFVVDLSGLELDEMPPQSQ